MSVVIRGMKMPETCEDCPLQHSEYLECKITHRITWGWADGGGTRTLSHAENDCPLVELPAQHGRLIDSSAIGLTDFEIVMCDGDYKEALKMLLEKIERVPTVIEAEGVSE